MVPKSGSQLPFSRITLSDRQLAEQIGKALQDELGASRRAAKTVIRWTGVSDHTARSWLNGGSSPSGSHLVMLGANSSRVMTTLLRLTGHGELALGLELQVIAGGLERALREIRAIQAQ